MRLHFQEEEGWGHSGEIARLLCQVKGGMREATAGDY